MNFQMPSLRTTAAFTTLLLAGCSTTPPQLPELDIPAQWQAQQAENASVWPELSWWAEFGHTELTNYMAQVRNSNFDLANTRRNIEIARLTLKDAGFDLYPQASANIGVYSSNSNTLGDGLPNNNTNTAQASIDLQYTDILKKPGQYRLALAQFDSTRAQAINTAIQTYNTAGIAFFQLLLERDKIRVAEQNLENAEKLKTIVQSRVENGVAPSIDLLQQSISVQQQRTSLNSLQQSEFAARASLALLSGKNVQQLSIASQTLASIHVPVVKAGLPAELLNRRPDLVQAYAELRAANANADLARMAFLPDISLTASAGATSSNLSELIRDPTTLITSSASVLQTLLDTGGRKRTSKRAKLQLENSLANYRKAALYAFNEVEIDLRNITLLKEQAKVAEGDLERAEQVYKIAQIRYQQGTTDFQTLMSAQNSLFEIRLQYLQNKMDRITALLNLYQALGGGWEKDSETNETF